MRCQDFSSLPRRERRAYPSGVCEERATPAAAKKTATAGLRPIWPVALLLLSHRALAAMLLRRAWPPVKS